MSRSKDPVELKMAQAFTSLICNHPFYASILLRLQRMEGHVLGNGGVVRGPCPCPPKKVWPECPHSMATDGKRLVYNPRFVLHLDSEELIGVLAHEVCHVAGLHPWRRMQRKPRSWNIACDKAVNTIVEDSKLKLPTGGIPGVPDKSAEELYHEDPDAGGDGDGCDPGGCGGVIDPTNPDGSQITEAERDMQMGEAKVMVQGALNAAKRAGKLPAGLARMVDEALEPKVPWKEILARFIDGNARHDYSWSRPNRRYLDDGIMFPSLWSPGYGQVVMGCDTSGSIDEKTLQEICSEVLGCLDVYAERGQSPELTVMWCDTEVSEQVVADAEELKPVGGGGTSFAPVFDHMREQGMQPRAIIYVTDGHCSDFGEPPECPVLWVLTETNKGFDPPFGEICCTLNE